jgi:hypothetical protein
VFNRAPLGANGHSQALASFAADGYVKLDVVEN